MLPYLCAGAGLDVLRLIICASPLFLLVVESRVLHVLRVCAPRVRGWAILAVFCGVNCSVVVFAACLIVCSFTFGHGTRRVFRVVLVSHFVLPGFVFAQFFYCFLFSMGVVKKQDARALDVFPSGCRVCGGYVFRASGVNIANTIGSTPKAMKEGSTHTPSGASICTAKRSTCFSNCSRTVARACTASFRSRVFAGAPSSCAKASVRASGASSCRSAVVIQVQWQAVVALAILAVTVCGAAPPFRAITASSNSMPATRSAARSLVVSLRTHRVPAARSAIPTTARIIPGQLNSTVNGSKPRSQPSVRAIGGSVRTVRAVDAGPARSTRPRSLARASPVSAWAIRSSAPAAGAPLSCAIHRALASSRHSCVSVRARVSGSGSPSSILRARGFRAGISVANSGNTRCSMIPPRMRVAARVATCATFRVSSVSGLSFFVSARCARVLKLFSCFVRYVIFPDCRNFKVASLSKV